MRRLLNTLYITNPKTYLRLDGETVEILLEDKITGKIPLHNLEAIVTSGFTGVSPALMAKCCKHGIELSFITQTNHFLSRVSGETRGNVILRREQFRIADDKNKSLKFSKSFIIGKIFNSRWVVERMLRDYPLRVNADEMGQVSGILQNYLKQVPDADNIDMLRGLEGKAAEFYFSVFDEMILQQKDDFQFKGRNRRPPRDAVNAMLSLAYILLSSSCQSALEMVGLDPYVGFMHTDRPGRPSLALDLVEELRSVFADRFVIKMINKRIITIKDFDVEESGAVRFKDEAKKRFLTEWQKRKMETIVHPFLNEKIEWGVVPYCQALLLARTIRGDLDGYPPFMWK